jgi:GT2 family glycosyltransferase
VRVAAVIPGFGKHKDVEKLLRDMSRLDLRVGTRRIEFWAVLVDNNTPVPLSTVPCPANLRLEHHRLSENTGGAGGFNAGMARVIAGEGLSGEFDPPDFIWCVDSDARVSRGCLKELVRVMLRREDVCAAGSALTDPTTGTTYEVGGVMHREFGFFRPAAMGDVDRRKLVRCQYLAACSALVRREAIEQTGLMPDIFIHGDDVEWFLQMREKTGKKIVAVPRSRAGHPLWNRKFQTWVRYYTTRNAYAPIDCVGFGGWCRFKRAMVDVLRAAGQNALGVKELAELHLLGLEDAAAGRVVKREIPVPMASIIAATKTRPFSELPGYLRAEQAKIGAGCKTYINPLLVMRSREFTNLTPAWRELGVHGMWHEGWHRRRLQGRPVRDITLALLRLAFTKHADIAVVPTGLPCGWFRGRTVVMFTSDGFFVRVIGRWEAVGSVVKTLVRGTKAALALGLRRRTTNTLPECPRRAAVPAPGLPEQKPNRQG